MQLKDRAGEHFGKLQDEICARLRQIDRVATLREDRWSYQPGKGPGDGGGITRVFEGGAVIEKGGVNLSALTGELSPRLATRLEVVPQPFFATGISLVIHPLSPMVPTVHMNLRYLELLHEQPTSRRRAWFGGGADLTPYYLREGDATEFHRALRSACESYGPEEYPRFKKWCDEYFHLPHRGEARGVGGIFFDYLSDDLEQRFDFVRGVGAAFLEAYPRIVERRIGEPWSEAQKSWQLIRRGRYVEFNLIHDRGTLFGLETNGRTESILMSLPPLAGWSYDHRPQAGSPEEQLLDALRTPRDWV